MVELVLDCVIPYIQDNDVLNSVSLVSTRCRDIDSLTRKHVTVHVHYLPDPERLSLRFPNLESLTLKSYSDVFHSAHKCHIPVTPWIQEISIKFTRLNSLCIQNMVVSPSDLKLLAETRGANLRSLELCDCDMFSEDGLIDIARYCTDLRRLCLDSNSVDNDYMPNGKWLHELALCNTVMESLDFHSPFDTYDMKDVIRLAKKCSKSLETLNIYPLSLSDFRKVFKHAKKLDKFCHGIIDEDWDYSGFKFPPSIRGLCIRDLRKASFPFLLPYLNQLRELYLYYNDLKHDCQCFLFERCPSLEVLVTGDPCGDEGLQVIGQFCKKLRILAHCGRVTHLGLIALAQGCPNLDYLDVDLLDISNEALECVGTHLKNLRVLRIRLRIDDGITNLPLDKGVRAMLMGCRKLETLEIGLCVGGLTDVGLGYIGEYGNNLRSLSLDDTIESDVGLLELLKGCPKLRELRLSDCPFSEEAIATFVFNINQSLRYVWLDYGSPDVLVLTRPMVSDEGYKARWLWKVPAPGSRKHVCNRDTEDVNSKRKVRRKTQMSDTFEGQTFMRERTCEGRCTLRAKKNIMKYLSCSNDISDYLPSPQVNRELMSVIESLQRQTKEMEESAVSGEEISNTDDFKEDDKDEKPETRVNRNQAGFKAE